MRYVVVGGGIVGVAIARSLALEGAEVTVLEKERALGQHQTSHNSGVVHMGLYYRPGSDKARFSRRGVDLLKAYCRDRGLPYDEIGKVLVARDDAEVERLRGIEQRARANGVPGLRWLDRPALADVEPRVVGAAGLHSPGTAVVDFREVARSFAADAERAGAEVRTGVEIADLASDPRPTLTTAHGEVFQPDRVVIAAGLHADRLAHKAGDTAYPRIIPFRGESLRLRDEARGLVRGLVYPVPDPRYPFLGVHITPRVDGGITVGPNAVLALAREGYGWGAVDRTEVAELVRSKGFRTFARANVRAGAREVWGSVNRRTFLAAARRYVPDLSREDVVGVESGVRAQAMDEDGTLVDDFRFTRVGDVFCIRNAPSPAATASLAIAEMVTERLRAG